MRFAIKYILAFPLLFSLLFISCSKEDEQVEYEVASDYMPVEIGAWYKYKVDSIFYNDFDNTSDTFEFQLLETYTDTFYDGSGQLNYRIERAKRFKNDTIAYDDLTWKTTDVWYVTVTKNSIQRVEENIRTVTLNSPVKEGLTWDGNAFNFKETWNFKYEKFGASFNEFDNTITVNQLLEDEFAILYQSYKEVFGKNVGMINREIIDVESQNIQVGVPVLDRIEKGFYYNQILIDYYLPSN